VSACQGDGASNADDCDDGDASVFPGATESCNGRDDDCDDAADDGLMYDVYPDADGDGYGADALVRAACETPVGFVEVGGDCAPGDGDVHPGALERCDEGGDEDCDGLVDDEDLPADPSTWYEDGDEDGYGVATTTMLACAPPAGFVADGSDCDDANPSANPGTDETCDGTDNDCDGTVDEPGAIGEEFAYEDLDGDGYGSEAASLGCPSEFRLSNDDDCDDGDSTVNPSATETCADGKDVDCDGIDPTCGVLAGTYRLSAAATLELVGETEARAGWSVKIISDRSLDSLADLLVSTRGSEVGTAPDATLSLTWSGPTGSRPLAYADATMEAGGGNSLWIAGDIDVAGDGTQETLIGAPLYREGGAYLIFELYTSTGIPASPRDGSGSTFSGEAHADRAGASVANAGDVNGDTWEDVLVGAPFNDAAGDAAGAAYLHADCFLVDLQLADAHWVFEGDADGDQAGSAVAGGIDIDGDGLHDIAVAAPGSDDAAIDAGEVGIFIGPFLRDRSMSAADAIWVGDGANAGAGWRLGSAGDLDGDGYGDLLVSAIGSDTRGLVYVLLDAGSGGSLAGASVVLEGEAGGDLAGAGLWGGDDVDGDSAPDALIGAPGNGRGGEDAGTVYVLPGPWSAGTRTLATAGAFLLGEEGSSAGWSVDAGGDTDGDGTFDILVGAPDADLDGNDSGAAWLLLGGP
jgi:hypothetical protein